MGQFTCYLCGLTVLLKACLLSIFYLLNFHSEDGKRIWEVQRGIVEVILSLQMYKMMKFVFHLIKSETDFSLFVGLFDCGLYIKRNN